MVVAEVLTVEISQLQLSVISKGLNDYGDIFNSACSSTWWEWIRFSSVFVLSVGASWLPVMAAVMPDFVLAAVMAVRHTCL
jgi:hypothetical protein